MKIHAITMGDPNGVGPEIIAKLLCSPLRLPKGHIPMVVGSIDIMMQALRFAGDAARPLVAIEDPEDAANIWPQGIPICDAHCKFGAILKPGKVDRAAGMASIAWVKAAVLWAKEGRVQSLVTAPICKESVEKTVPGFQGHTEFIGEMVGDPEPVLALVHGSWVVAHVSTHVSLSSAITMATQSRILKVGTLLHQFLIKYRKLTHPRIGVAGINPHAGEHGLFGREEIEQIEPAVKQLRKLGIDATGPLPGDVVFPQLKAKQFDGVVAMYHDQGHVVTKTLYFELGDLAKPSMDRPAKQTMDRPAKLSIDRPAKLRGVNTTLGLPVLRTSVDHGTGFPIAWQGIADCSSLRDALLLATKLAD